MLNPPIVIILSKRSTTITTTTTDPTPPSPLDLGSNPTTTTPLPPTRCNRGGNRSHQSTSRSKPFSPSSLPTLPLPFPLSLTPIAPFSPSLPPRLPLGLIHHLYLILFPRLGFRRRSTLSMAPRHLRYKLEIKVHNEEGKELWWCVTTLNFHPILYHNYSVSKSISTVVI